MGTTAILYLGPAFASLDISILNLSQSFNSSKYSHLVFEKGALNSTVINPSLETCANENKGKNNNTDNNFLIIVYLKSSIFSSNLFRVSFISLTSS